MEQEETHRVPKLTSLIVKTFFKGKSLSNIRRIYDTHIEQERVLLSLSCCCVCTNECSRPGTGCSECFKKFSGIPFSYILNYTRITGCIPPPFITLEHDTNKYDGKQRHVTIMVRSLSERRWLYCLKAYREARSEDNEKIREHGITNNAVIVGSMEINEIGAKKFNEAFVFYCRDDFAHQSPIYSREFYNLISDVFCRLGAYCAERITREMCDAVFDEIIRETTDTKTNNEEEEGNERREIERKTTTKATKRKRNYFSLDEYNQYTISKKPKRA